MNVLMIEPTKSNCQDDPDADDPAVEIGQALMSVTSALEVLLKMMKRPEGRELLAKDALWVNNCRATLDWIADNAWHDAR